MSLQSVKEIAAIHELVDSWLRITSYSQARETGGLYPEGPYSFQATVQITPEVAEKTPWGTAPREVRAYLLGRIEDAVEALEVAGWWLAEGPYVRISTMVTRRAGLPPLQGPVEVTVSFMVDKERSEEERAMDPEVVADRIFTQWASGDPGSIELT